MNKIFLPGLLGILTVLIVSCGSGNNNPSGVDKPKYIKKYRDDGTLRSVTTVNEENYAHGLKVNYYDDGKTVHSKITFDNGRKHGPAIWYYKNGQVFEHTGFQNNLREGLTKKYYKSGKLMAEYSYEKDLVMPGLKEYTEDGTLITDYPGINIRQIDKLKTENMIILEISSDDKRRNVKYYQLVKLNELQYGRSYIDSNRGVARLEYYVHGGNVLNKTIEFYAEIPTELGNYLVIKKTYPINVMNL